MAGKLGGQHNCPTSDRDGKCVVAEVVIEAIREIESTNGQPFMPTPNDIAAREQREREALFLSHSATDQRLALENITDDDERAELLAEIEDREAPDLWDMPEPTAGELAELEQEAA